MIACVPGVLFLACVAYADDVLPRGTEFVVRIDRDISLATARPGDIFPAIIDEDVMSRGRVIIPRGERAEVRLIRVREGVDEVAFRLHTIFVHRHEYPIMSDTARQYRDRRQPPPSGKGSLLGAAGGAVLGGVVGGSQGALRGAVIGAGGGYSWTGQSRMNARVSSGTRFLFTSKEDVFLRG